MKNLNCKKRKRGKKEWGAGLVVHRYKRDIYPPVPNYNLNPPLRGLIILLNGRRGGIESPQRSDFYLIVLLYKLKRSGKRDILNGQDRLEKEGGNPPPKSSLISINRKKRGQGNSRSEGSYRVKRSNHHIIKKMGDGGMSCTNQQRIKSKLPIFSKRIDSSSHFQRFSLRICSFWEGMCRARRSETIVRMYLVGERISSTPIMTQSWLVPKLSSLAPFPHPPSAYHLSLSFLSSLCPGLST